MFSPAALHGGTTESSAWVVEASTSWSPREHRIEDPRCERKSRAAISPRAYLDVEPQAFAAAGLAADAGFAAVDFAAVAAFGAVAGSAAAAGFTGAAYFLRNLSTRPPVSTIFCLPV